MTPRKATAVAVALTLVIALGACSAENEGTTTDATDTSSKTLVPTDWDVAAASAVKAGGTLNLSIDKLPDNYNDQAGVGHQVDLESIDPTRGNAVAIRSDGTWQVDANYAKSVELVDKDPQIVEVKLNRKAVWTDGKPITAADMIAYWKAMNGSDKEFDVASPAGFEDIGSIEQGDDKYSYTVKFATKNADWPSLVYPQLAASVTASAKTFNEGFIKKAVPSNGPFAISKIDQVAGTITETPNPKWWGEKPKLAKIVFRAIDPTRQAAQFAAKKLDAVKVDQDKAAYDIAKQRDGAQIQRSYGLSWTHLTFNSTRGPLKDVKVRRAIAHALDRRQMSASLNKPVGAPAIDLGSMIYVPGQKGYRDAAAKIIGFDLAKSETLLKEAGYTKGSDGLQAKDGKPLALSITVPSDTPVNANRAQLIQGYLKKVGITVTLDTVPSAKYFNDYVIPLNFDLASFSWEGSPFPVSTRQDLFSPVDSGQNFTGITNPQLAGLWKKADSELDLAKRIAIAQGIDDVLYGYVPLVTIAPTPHVVLVAKGLANYGASQFERPDYTKVGYKK